MCCITLLLVLCAAHPRNPLGKVEQHYSRMYAVLPWTVCTWTFFGPFPASVNNNKYILVITDQFTKWVEAFAVQDQTSETTAKKLVEEFIARFGAPLQIHTDQGRNVQSDLFKAVCKLFGVTQTRTTPYHPASNGQMVKLNISTGLYYK